jgi:hypothetical protein
LTFHPAIDNLSRALASRTAAALAAADAASRAGRRSSSVSQSAAPSPDLPHPSPPRVFDRLYASAFGFAQLRSAAVQAAIDRELEGATFQPQILTRSRAMASIQERVLAALTDAGGEGGGGSGSSSVAASGAAPASSVFDRLYAHALTEPEVRTLRLEISKALELRGCTFHPEPFESSGAAAAGGGSSPRWGGSASSVGGRGGAGSRLSTVSAGGAQLSRARRPRPASADPLRSPAALLQQRGRPALTPSGSTQQRRGRPSEAGSSSSALGGSSTARLRTLSRGRPSSAAGDSSASASRPRDVFSELASEHKDYAKLAATKARLELATCTFQPDTKTQQGLARRALGPTVPGPSLPSPRSAAGRSVGGDRLTVGGHSAVDSDAAIGVVRPAGASVGARVWGRERGCGLDHEADARPPFVDVWDRIVAGVEADSAAGRPLTPVKSARSVSPRGGSSVSPAVNAATGVTATTAGGAETDKIFDRCGCTLEGLRYRCACRQCIPPPHCAGCTRTRLRARRSARSAARPCAQISSGSTASRSSRTFRSPLHTLGRNHPTRPISQCMSASSLRRQR